MEEKILEENLYLYILKMLTGKIVISLKCKILYILQNDMSYCYAELVQFLLVFEGHHPALQVLLVHKTPGAGQEVVVVNTHCLWRSS